MTTNYTTISSFFESKPYFILLTLQFLDTKKVSFDTFNHLLNQLTQKTSFLFLLVSLIFEFRQSNHLFDFSSK